MAQSLTLDGKSSLRYLSFFSGLGMIFASYLTIKHFYDSTFPTSIWAGSFCDINAFFNCDSSAFSALSAIRGVPLGYFGVVVGALVSLGALFPSAAFERTNKTISLANAVGVIFLLGYSVLYLGSLCLLCSGYYVFAIVSFVLYWRYGIDRDQTGMLSRWFRPSTLHVVTYAVLTLAGAYGFAQFYEAKREAQSGGVAARIVDQFFGLPVVDLPTVISPFMTAQATESFTDAPIQIIEYADLLCSDCLYLNQQLERLKREFAGQFNIAFQFFPLDAQCNSVVAKDKHPGACDLSYMAAYDPNKFQLIHDEIFANFEAAKDSAWRVDLARRHGVEAALTDSATRALVHSIINTGMEYQKTSAEYEHGIRSTPTMIINNRMIIGTFPYAQLRAIFRALIEQVEPEKDEQFLENWVDTD